MRTGRQQGFTLLELILVVALVIILFAVAIENLLPLRAAAERAAHVATVGNLRTAAGHEAIRRVLARHGPGLAEMDGANPIEWLVSPPAGYAGHLPANRYDEVSRAGWAFDPVDRVLFYRVRYPEYVEGAYPSPPGIRYQVVVSRTADGGVRDVSLVQLETAEWRLSGSEVKRWLNRITS